MIEIHCSQDEKNSLINALTTSNLCIKSEYGCTNNCSICLNDEITWKISNPDEENDQVSKFLVSYSYKNKYDYGFSDCYITFNHNKLTQQDIETVRSKLIEKNGYSNVVIFSLTLLES